MLSESVHKFNHTFCRIPEFLPALKAYFDANEWDPDLSTAEIVRKNTTERRKRHGESS